MTENAPGALEPDGRLEVGSVVKPHGILGDVIVSLVTDRLERVAPGSVLVGSSERLGGPTELVVVSARPHQQRWIVHFEGWADRNAAEELRGARLTAEPLEDVDALWVHELIGVEVFDQGGIGRGCVVAVEANPASDIMVLDSGSLVPVRFIVDRVPERIVVEVPEGLFELTGPRRNTRAEPS